MKNRTRIEHILFNYVYATPHKLSTAVFVTVHSCLISSQGLIGKNYLITKADQFREYPLTTTFEVMVPYLVTYTSSSIGRRINQK
jgi:hypothetical protein